MSRLSETEKRALRAWVVNYTKWQNTQQTLSTGVVETMNVHHIDSVSVDRFNVKLL